MNDCFKDSHILIIDLNKASVTFYNFLTFKKISVEFVLISAILECKAAILFLLWNVFFLSDWVFYGILLSLQSNLLKNYDILLIWRFLWLHSKNSDFLLVTLQQINSFTLIFISATRPIVCLLNTEKNFWKHNLDFRSITHIY